MSWDEATGQGNAYFTYVYGSHVADIRIDTSTGKIEVKNITAAHDVGKVLNKLGAEGQVYGGVTQGFGYAVIEDYNIQDGVVKSDNLDNYLIPTIKDIGNIDPILIENEDVDGPFGAKSLGEPTLELTSSAINNALKFATGKHSYELPLTLEKVFLGINLRKPSRQSQIAAHDSCKTHIKVADKQTLRITDVKTQTPKNFDDALELLSKNELQIISGGTDMIIELRMKTGNHKLLDISHIQEIQKIKIENNEIRIGGGCTFTKILSHKKIQKHFPMLVQACSTIGSLQIRNKGTIGGNIVNAAPCADSYPPLIAYNAEFILTSVNGIRKIKADEFILKNYKTQLKSDEILTEIIIPIPKKNYEYSYFQLGRRNAVNITRISIGILVSFKENEVEECKIISGSLFHKPMRIEEIEKLLIGKHLTRELIDSIEEPLKKIIDDAIGKRWSSEYKQPVFINMAKDALTEILKQRG